ncbi:MAG TPA: Hpt domain-containing protein [Desulfobulbus sp.]|nr:Hpt domain-containing protein [Desulfobulbus sp.]
MKGQTYRQTIRDHLASAYLLTEEKIDAVLPAFLDTLLAHMLRLEKNLADNDLEQLAKSGHVLKGALLNLGLHELADMAHAIEQCCATPATVPELPQQVSRLRTEIASFTRQAPRRTKQR